MPNNIEYRLKSIYLPNIPHTMDSVKHNIGAENTIIVDFNCLKMINLNMQVVKPKL
jgi:hypothetical protein